VSPSDPRILRVDIETYSATDLRGAGVYRYVQDPSFQVLLFGYQRDDGPTMCIDLTKDPLPPHIAAALQDPSVTKVAWNAGFELECLSQHLGVELDPAQWVDTMVHSLMCGLPAQLKEAGEVLGMPQHLLKRAHGRQLISYFCVPCKPTKTNGGRTRNLPEHDPDKWALFVDYCAQDVVSERAIAEELLQFPVDPSEWGRWRDDIRINRRGVQIEQTLAGNAIAANDALEARHLAEMAALTGLENPNSLQQLKDWLHATDGELITSITKDNLPDLIKNAKSDVSRRALELRAAVSKSSVDKYEAALRCVCPDGRARGLLQFYGANRTGRAAGRLVQIQNAQRNSLPDLNLARELLLQNRIEDLELLFGPLQKTLGELVRTMFVPKPGCVYVVVDEKAIEARVLAWLAQEQWRLDVFNGHGNLYEASASQMFNVPWEEFEACIKQKKKHPLRFKGKVAELAFGYQGASNAAITMGALEQGLKIEELDGLVQRWRTASPRIASFDYNNPGFWVRIEAAAVECVRSGRGTQLLVGPPSGGASIRFSLVTRRARRALYCWLPSGRPIVYWNPDVREGSFGKDQVQYEGYQKNGTWGVLNTYGGKLTENVTQAVARDVLFSVLDKVSDRTVFHVHDEIVLEVEAEQGEAALRSLEERMCLPVSWAPGLPLGAEGEVMPYYRKGD
jgi:DNA polymerase bacteriophage-type